MARTRAGLSGRPTCRPGVICPGLSAPQGWPLAAMPAGLPVGTLRPCLTSAVELPRAASAALRSLFSGQRPAGVAFLSWLLVFAALVLHWCRFLAVVVVSPCAACRASTKSYGRRPSIYREGEPPKVGEPRRGAPVADRFAALRFVQAVELSTVWGAPTTCFYIFEKDYL